MHYHASKHPCSNVNKLPATITNGNNKCKGKKIAETKLIEIHGSTQFANFFGLQFRRSFAKARPSRIGKGLRKREKGALIKILPESYRVS